MSELRFEVVGAAGARRYFDALTRERLAHAYLFTGPPGVGKKTFARRLAQSLLCEAPRAGSLLGYDGTCRSCMLFASDRTAHPDFIEHQGTMKIGSSDAPSGFSQSEELSARDVVRQFSLQSYAGGMRLLLLGDIEFAGPPAANALLRFLEEPPAGVLMLLTTPAPEKLLETIRSRLVEVRFPLLRRAEIVEVVRARGASQAEAERAAAFAAGSLARAFALRDDDESSTRALVVRWFFEVLDRGLPEEGWATRESLEEALEIVTALVRDWVATSSVRGSFVAAMPDQRERTAHLPPLLPDRAVALLAKLGDAQRLAGTNVPPSMVAEIVRMALSAAATSAA